MARATPIRNAAQGDYRLREECSTDTARVMDAPVEYRLAGVSGHPIERIGNGWRVFDRTPGAPMAPDELDEMRAVMVGADPRTGQRLIGPPKMATAKAAKLPARPFLEAVLARGKRGLKIPADSWAARRLGRMARGVTKDREHTVPVKDLEKAAKAVGVDLAAVYPAKDLAHAQEHKHDRVEARVRGWDLTLDAPKSVSVLYALGDADTAARVEAAYLAAVRETVATVEEWTAYGQRGEHGRGRTARRVGTHGLTGTLTLHTTARPIDGTADPHLHAHVMISNLARGVDGQWGGIAAGGRELYTNVPAIGELMRARLRDHLTRDLGVRWVEESPGRWEIAGIGADVRDLYSRRRDQAVKQAGKNATPAGRRLAARRSAAAKLTGHAATDRRTEWAERARKAKVNPGALVATVLGRGLVDDTADRDQDHEHVRDRRADTVAARLWREKPTKAVNHAHLIGRAAASSPTGMDVVEATAVADAVTARSEPAGGTARGAHLRHATRWQAPRLTPAQARAGQGPAARAAHHTVAALKARHQQAREREQAARARLSDLARLADAGRFALWRAGTTRDRVRDEQATTSGELSSAAADAARIEGQIRKVRAAAVNVDVEVARAQERAREALRQTRQHAQARAALRRSAVTPPKPTRPTKGKGRKFGPPGPYLPPTQRPRGPDRDHGPSL